MMKDLLHASAVEAKTLTNVVFRDPFQGSQKPADAPKPQKADVADDSEADPLTELVRGLALDATFVQGQTQIAIINGRMREELLNETLFLASMRSRSTDGLEVPGHERLDVAVGPAVGDTLQRELSPGAGMSAIRWNIRQERGLSASP